MFDFVGLAYELIKDLKDYLKWKEETKLVSLDWIEKSGFVAEAAKSGIDLRWSRPEKIESRRLDGWELMYELDKLKRVRRKIAVKDGSLLVGRQKST